MEQTDGGSKLLLLKNIYDFFFFICCSIAHGHSFRDGHKRDIKAVFEGVKGVEFDNLIKLTSDAIDTEFPSRFREKFGKLPGNHRILGHWGFEGSIPFEYEPYKSAFEPYSKKKIAFAWQQLVNELTDTATRKTGLPKKQAKALVGLVYNTHILGDWVPGNTIVEPLTSPELIRRDVSKNLHRLFGNNSKFVQAIEAELANISCTNSKPKCAEEILDVLHKHVIGEKLYNTHGKILSRAGISFKPIMQTPFEATSSTRLNKTPTKLNDYNKYTKAKNAKIYPGILLNDGRLLVSLKEGASAGIIVFAAESAFAIYQYMNGDIFKPEFERKLADASIKGGAVAGGTAVAVLLGSNPAGWIVAGIGVGSYFISDAALTVWHESQDAKYINRDDLAVFGIEIDSVLEIEIDPDIPLNVEVW